MKKLVALFLALMMAGLSAFALAEDFDWDSYAEIIYDYFEDFDEDGTIDYAEDYDKDGNVIASSLYFFDDDKPLGRLVGRLESDGSWTYVAYDGEEQQLGSFSYNVESDGSEVYKYYDTDGELTGVQIDDWDCFSFVYFSPDGTLLEAWIDDAWYDSETGKWYNYETGEEVAAPDLSAYLKMAGFKMKPDVTWYTHNTVGVIGISLRDEYPTLTKKWYNVLPVDLSKDGSQTFQLVASNMYYVGTVTVTVSGDSVTTTYNYPTKSWYEFYPESECIKWFAGVKDIGSAFLENPTSDMKFGEAISKAKDLNGQDIGLLFICNRLTYRVPYDDSGVAPIRFWRNHHKMAEYFASTKALFEKMNGESAK